MTMLGFPNALNLSFFAIVSASLLHCGKKKDDSAAGIPRTTAAQIAADTVEDSILTSDDQPNFAVAPDYKSMACEEIAAQIQQMADTPCGEAGAVPSCDSERTSEHVISCDESDMVCMDELIQRTQLRLLTINNCIETKRLREQSCDERAPLIESLCRDFATASCTGAKQAACMGAAK